MKEPLLLKSEWLIPQKNEEVLLDQGMYHLEQLTECMSLVAANLISNCSFHLKLNSMVLLLGTVSYSHTTDTGKSVTFEQAIYLKSFFESIQCTNEIHYLFLWINLILIKDGTTIRMSFASNCISLCMDSKTKERKNKPQRLVKIFNSKKI